MTEAQIIVAHAARLLMLAALVGIFRRGLARQCWTLVAYLAACVVCNTLITYWPAQFWTRSFWMWKQTLYEGLLLGIALELSWHTLRAFPGALRTWRLVLAGVLTGIGAFVVVGPLAVSAAPWDAAWRARVAHGTIWLLASLAVVASWYSLPLSRWHRAILSSLAPYLLVTQAVAQRLAGAGWSARSDLSMVATLAFVALVGWWAVAAWTAAAPARASAPRQIEAAA